MHSTTPGVAGTGVGWDRMTAPAASNFEASTRHVVAVGRPWLVADKSWPQTVARATDTTPGDHDAGPREAQPPRHRRPDVSGHDGGDDGADDVCRRPAPG